MARIKKRRGKDLNILWQVTVSDGTSIHDVAASNQLKLEAYDQRNNLYELTIDSVDQDGIHAKFPGELQKNCGNYRLTLWVNKDTDGTTVVDLQGAFELVPYSQMESSYNMLDAEGSLVITTMDIEYGLTRLAEFAGALSDLQDMVIDTFTSEVSGNNIALTIESDGGYSWAVTLTPVTSSAPGLMTSGMLAQLNQASQDCEQNERDIDANQQAIAALQQALANLDLSTDSVTEDGSTQRAINTELRKALKTLSVQFGDASNIVLEGEKINGNTQTYTIPAATDQAAGAMSAAHVAALGDLSGKVQKIESYSYGGAGSAFYTYTLTAGKEYKVTNTSASGTINVMSASTDSTGNVVETFKNNLAVGASVEFTPSTTAPYLQIYFSSSSGGSLTIEDLDSLMGDVAALQEQTTQLENDVTACENSIEDINDVIGEPLEGTHNAVGSQYYDYKIIAGRTYAITNTGMNGTLTAFSCSEKSIGHDVETLASSIAIGTTKEYTATSDAPYLRIYYAAAGSFRIIEKSGIVSNIETLKDDVDDAFSEIAEIKEESIGEPLTGSYNSVGSQFYEYNIKAGDTYIVTNTGANGTINVMSASTNSSGNVVETFKNSLAIGASYEFTPTLDAPYLQIYYAAAGSFSIILKDGIRNVINTLSEDVAELTTTTNEIYSKLPYDVNVNASFLSGLISSTDGSVVNNSSGKYAIIDIEDKGYKSITAKISTFSGNYGYGFFLSDNSWVGVHTTSTTEVVIPVPDDAVEFRMCYNVGDYTSQSLTAKVLFDSEDFNDKIDKKVSESDLTNLKDTTELDINDYLGIGYCVSSEDGSLVASGTMPYVIINLQGKYYQKIKFYTSVYGYNYGYGYFLSDNTWVGVHTTANAQVEIDLPDDAVEFRLCWQPADIPSTDGQHIYVTGFANISELREDITEARINRLPYPFYPTWDLTLVPAQEVISSPAAISDYYAIWDEFVTDYPDWVTKVDCSEAATALGITAPSYLDDCPIYMYQFIPKRAGTNYELSRPRLKVMLISGLHSNEMLDMFLLPRFFQMLNDNFATDKTAQQLRTMVDFYVIPCLNPWGYVNRNNTGLTIPIPGRQNGNGVNLNRNFPTENWTLSGSPTDSDGNYSGATAGSEYETKIAMYYAEQIMPNCFFDLHTGGMLLTGAYGSCEIHNYATDEEFSVVLGMSRNIINRWIVDNSNFPSDPDTAACVFDARTSSVNGECHRWFYENITHISILTEEAVTTYWENGVIQQNVVANNTPTIWRENLQALYNSIMFIVKAASDKLFD